MHQNTAQIIIKCYYLKIKNIFVFRIFLIVLRPVFYPTYKQKKQVKKYI